MKGRAEIHWQGDRLDQQALAERHDWSGLNGLEQLWPALAERYGEALALEAPHSHPPQYLSYAALNTAIGEAAAAFAALGVRAGDVVALFAENSPRWLVADQGLMRAGAADAVRGSTAPIDELRYILENSGAIGLVVESAELLRHLDLGSQQRAALRFVLVIEDSPAVAPTSPGTDAPVLPVLPCLSWDAFAQRGAAASLPALPAGGPQRMATLLYTSGTTGRPKGVPLSHANLLHQLGSLGVAVSPQPGDRALSVLPIWHAYERMAEYFLLSCGCQQAYTTLKHLRNDLQRVKPQYMISVPRLWEALLAGFEDALAAMPSPRRRLIGTALGISRFHALQRRRALNLTLTNEPPGRRLLAASLALASLPLHGVASRLFWPKVRQQLVGGVMSTAISGGGALALHVDGFFEAIGIELLVGYGLTETSPVLACRRRWHNRRGSAGQPLPGTALKIVDAESGAPLAWGERGRVLGRGPQVMGGYFRNPEATSAVLDGEGWFDTGDLGHLMPDGTLVLTGRAKDTIVLSSGENIEPGPLEDALVAHPLVEQLMLVGQDRRQLAALMVARAERPSPEVLRGLKGEFNRLLAARPGSRSDERICGVALVEPFTIENGLLTQTLKQRRDRIASRDADAIESLYRS